MTPSKTHYNETRRGAFSYSVHRIAANVRPFTARSLITFTSGIVRAVLVNLATMQLAGGSFVSRRRSRRDCATSSMCPNQNPPVCLGRTWMQSADVQLHDEEIELRPAVVCRVVPYFTPVTDGKAAYSGQSSEMSRTAFFTTTSTSW